MSKHDADIFCSKWGSFVVSPDWLMSVGQAIQPGLYWTEYKSFPLHDLNKGIT